MNRKITVCIISLTIAVTVMKLLGTCRETPQVSW